MVKNFFVSFFVIVLSAIDVSAQGYIDKPTLGIEFKPVIPSELSATNNNTVASKYNKNEVFTLSPRVGYSAGAVVRASLSRMLSIESGIYYTARIFGTSGKDSAGRVINDRFRFDNYEVPFLALIYIRLSKDFYINNAFGLSFDFLPEDVQTQPNSFYYVRVGKEYWVLPTLMANVGLEYRTQNSGYFYIGGLYHRMFTPLGAVGFYYNYNGGIDLASSSIDGHYFALDFKYFFPTKRTPIIDNGY